MSSTTSPTERVLPELYTSGKHSDLVIRSQDGREFRVHKCIVSSKSAFFDGACRGGTKEAQSGVIEVEEHGEVMDALFRHIYEAPIEWLPTGADTDDDLKKKATMQTLELAKNLRVASDKYLVGGLGRGTTLALFNCLLRHNCGTTVELVHLCSAVFNGGVATEMSARYKALDTLTSAMPKIITDAAAWAVLSSDQVLSRAATACMMFAVGLGTTMKGLEYTQMRFQLAKFAATFARPEDEPMPNAKQLKELVLDIDDMTSELKSGPTVAGSDTEAAS